ncbi:ATP-binding protein, partial [Caenispirillum bisanense]
LLITANQPFGQWDRIFPDKAMTIAAIDRLVHHATIFELNVESYRRRTAVGRDAASSATTTEVDNCRSATTTSEAGDN